MPLNQAEKGRLESVKIYGVILAGPNGSGDLVYMVISADVETREFEVVREFPGDEMAAKALVAKLNGELPIEQTRAAILDHVLESET